MKLAMSHYVRFTGLAAVPYRTGTGQALAYLFKNYGE